MLKELNWKDVTSYSQSEPRADRVPRTWRLELAPQLGVTVMSGHLYYKGEWVMNFEPWIRLKQLDMDVERFSADEAKAVALFHVRETMKSVNAAFDETLGTRKETTLEDLVKGGAL